MSRKLSSSSPDVGTNFAVLDDGYQVLSADGAISIKDGVCVITKGTAVAATLAKPTAGAISAGGDDGRILRVVSSTAAAHVITCSTDGFNAKGSSGTATFGAAIGNGTTLIAYNGHWYNLAQTGITYA